MVSVTLSIPAELREQMDQHSEINWSGFIRKCIDEKLSELSWKERMSKMLERDREFEDWCLQMGDKVNAGVAKRLRREGLL
ncbi:MAG: hypothetical protein ABIF10_02075 [Candidatus Woesearchaeota archaeon]